MSSAVFGASICFAFRQVIQKKTDVLQLRDLSAKSKEVLKSAKEAAAKARKQHGI